MSHPEIKDEDLAEIGLEFIYQVAAMQHPLAAATAEFLLSQRSRYFEYVGEHENGRGENFARKVRTARRDKLIRETGMSATELAKALDRYAGGRLYSSLLRSRPPEVDPRRRLHDILVLNYGNVLQRSQLYEIVSF